MDSESVTHNGAYMDSSPLRVKVQAFRNLVE
jgi:hypothetical protein